MDNNTVKIFDTTLRDGEQSPGASMNTEEKIQIAKQLEKLGVDIIEAGFGPVIPWININKIHIHPVITGNKR